MNIFWIKTFAVIFVTIVIGLVMESLLKATLTFGVLAIAAWTPLYIKYAHDNPQHLWFKRKLFGWGWTPVTWQGWSVIAIYLVLVSMFGLTIDQNSPPNEIAFTFIIPIAILTTLLIRIAYRKGEKPKWQWGKDIEKYK